MRLATTRVEAPATGGSAPSNAGSVPASDVRGNPLYLASPQPSRVKFRETVSVFQFDKDWNVIDTCKKIVLAHTELDTKSGAYVNSKTVKPLASTASALA